MEGPRLLPCQNCVAHTGQITSMTLGPRTGLVFATGGTDNMFNLFAIGKDLPLISFGPLKSYVTSCQFERSEEIIVCGTNGGSTILYDIAAEKSLSQWSVCSSSVNAVAFDPSNSQSLAACCNDGRVQILSTNCHAPVATFNISQKAVTSIAYSPDGQYIAVGGEDTVLNIYDVRASQILAYHELHKGTINSIAWNKEGNIVLSGGSDRTLRLFNIDTFRSLEPTLPLNPAEIKSVRFLNKANAAIAVSSSLLNVINYEEVSVYDRFKFSLGSVYDMQAIKGNIIIASSQRDHAIINRVKLETLSPFSPYSKKTAQKPGMRRVASQDSNTQKKEIRRSSEGNTPNRNDEAKIYNEFRRERAPFLTQMTERCSRITRLGDMIEECGLEKTIEVIGESGDLQPEIAQIVMRRPKAIKLESAAPLMLTANKLFQTDPAVALSLVDAVLTTFGKMTFATMRTNGNNENLQQRKALCQEMIDAYHLNVPEIQKLASQKGPLKKVASEMLLQWRSL